MVPLTAPIFQYLRTGHKEANSDAFWSDAYPSARWERALHQWAATNDKRRAKRFCHKMCELLPDLQSIEMHVQHLRIAPLGSQERFLDGPSFPKDTVVDVTCDRGEEE